MNSGHKIIEGLKQAIAGDMARVTIEGQVWERILPPWDHATPTETPKEVMPNQSDDDGGNPRASARSSTEKELYKPHPHPASASQPGGGMEPDVAAWLEEMAHCYAYQEHERQIFERAAAELTRLRTAPPVTEEMARRAFDAWGCGPSRDWEIIAIRRHWTKIVAAALTPGGEG